VGSYQIATPNKPVDLVNFGRVQDLPLVLAGFVAALAVATLAHLLVSSIRRRRRDLAVLKTLGFVPAQVRAAVAWQATTLAVVAVALGIPIGVAAGRWAWLAFTHQLGIVPEAAVPLLVLLVMIPATLVVANLVAVLPARAAARAQPAGVLRSE
jgi:ABC-type lipoprotein release transport system permease subunit